MLTDCQNNHFQGNEYTVWSLSLKIIKYLKFRPPNFSCKFSGVLSRVAGEMSKIKINDDKTMVSFDVVSLFPAIPVQKACQYIRTKLEQNDTNI